MTFDRTIFVTGFPGFIAERLVERLAAANRQIFLLVQPQFVEKAIESVEEIAERTATPIENFALIEGDITRPDLEMSSEDAGLVRESATDVFHLAAIYDLAVAKGPAYEVNLEGTRNVNAFAASLPKLKRYNYISTCYVAGRRTGPIREDELRHDAGFRNFYEESKYLAESEVEKLKAELPVTIFRPSVVVGDSQSGETAKYDGIYHLIEYLKIAPAVLRLVNVGNKDVRLNLVPVDFVVDAIAALAFDDESKGKTIALADPSPLSTGELFDVIAEKLSGKRSAIGPPAALVERLLMLPVTPKLTGLPHSGVPYFFLAQTYDTSIADKLLKKHGITCPNFRDYAANLLKFVAMHPQL
ncbi:MAG: SDR family oxidoreductase [Acidobacteria bacterium]|nr:SDR family oxidoreductase [Acidobacteriota bacterium]